jgi:hypothetical protein
MVARPSLFISALVVHPANKARLQRPLQLRTFSFNNLQDAPPATSFSSVFCMVARGAWGGLLQTNQPPNLTTLQRAPVLPFFAPCYLVCLHTNTNCPFCKSFFLITMQIAGGGWGPPSVFLKFPLNSRPCCSARTTAPHVVPPRTLISPTNHEPYTATFARRVS